MKPTAWRLDVAELRGVRGNSDCSRVDSLRLHRPECTAIKRREYVTTARSFTTEAPSRDRKLVAARRRARVTVRPNLDAVAVVPPHSDGATASTATSPVLTDLGAELDSVPVALSALSTRSVAAMARKATRRELSTRSSDRIVKACSSPAPTPRRAAPHRRDPGPGRRPPRQAPPSPRPPRRPHPVDLPRDVRRSRLVATDAALAPARPVGMAQFSLTDAHFRRRTAFVTIRRHNRAHSRPYAAKRTCQRIRSTSTAMSLRCRRSSDRQSTRNSYRLMVGDVCTVSVSRTERRSSRRHSCEVRLPEALHRADVPDSDHADVPDICRAS